MHHPGPPRFLATGDAIELAPRDPDPEGIYEWRVLSAPDGSAASTGPGPVETFTPDRPGKYTIGLDAPDGSHELTVRAFPDVYGPTDVAGGSAEAIRTGTVEAGRDVEPEYGYVGPNGSAGHDGAGRPRVRLDATIESETVVVRATPRPNPASDRGPETLDVEFLVDDRDVAASIESGRPSPRAVAIREGREIRIPREAIDERLRVHGVTVTTSAPAAISVADAVLVEDPNGGEPAISRLNDPPEWALNATVYEIFVRGFAPDDAAETPLQEIRDRIPRIAELGVDCLWLTPVLQHDQKPHGYNITDFFAIANDLGDRDAYEELIATAHEHGMRVLFDFVANHTAREHPWFRDAYRNPDSPYRDHYEWQANGEPGTYFDWELIANLNHRNLHVRRFLLDVIDAWAPLADGFRCDMAWAVPNSFWRELRGRVKALDSEFLLMDETIPYIPDFHEGMFDVHFDASLYFQLRQIGRGDAPAETLLDAIDQRTEIGFPDHAAFLQYVENHDETRYRVECGDDAAAAAVAAIATLPGLPMVYAGGEIGQRGKRDEIAWEHAREEVRERHRRLIELRHDHHALATDADLDRIAYRVQTDPGAIRTVKETAETAHPDDVVAFRRTNGDESVAVVLNFGSPEAIVELGPDIENHDLVTGTQIDPVAGAIPVGDVVVLPLTDGND